MLEEMEDKTLIPSLIFRDQTSFHYSAQSRQMWAFGGQYIHTKQVSTKEIPLRTLNVQG